MQLTVYQMSAKANGFKDRDILLKFDCLIKTKSLISSSTGQHALRWIEKG